MHVTNSFANDQTRKNLVDDLSFCDFFMKETKALSNF